MKVFETTSIVRIKNDTKASVNDAVITEMPLTVFLHYKQPEKMDYFSHLNFLSFQVELFLLYYYYKIVIVII